MVEWLAVYQGALALSVAVSSLASWIAWENRANRGATPLAVLLAAQAVWALSTLLSTLVPGTQLAVFSSKVVITSVVTLVVALFLFALEYTGRESYITRESLSLLSIEPVVLTALIWTNEAHGLVYSVLEPSKTGPSGLNSAYGPAFVAHSVYSYLLIGAAVFLIVVFALRSRYFYQRQVAAIVVATLVPWAANAVSLAMGFSIDLTPVAFTVTGVAFTWAVVNEEFLDITPIATEAVLDRIDTAVVVVDTSDRIVDINRRARGLLDASEDEAVVGDHVREWIADLPDALTSYEELTDGKTAETREFEAGDRYFRLQSSPLLDRRDDVVGYALLVVDLTDQRRREEQLRRRNEQLDRFVGVVSHDLRNPLQVADGRLTLARDTGEDEHFEAVSRSHDRMERLIEDLLSLARQNEDLDTKRLDPGDVAREAWSHVATAEADLTVELDGLSVEADPDRLSQFFENLFRNAVEHGGDDVRISVESLPDGSGFAVTDDGPGFGDADVDSVFEDGYTTSRDGTGFGLSIVAEIADQHGWSVEAVDADGAGARIEVRTGEKIATVN